MLRNIFIAGLLFAPHLASAHTRWFADYDLSPLTTTEPTNLYVTIWAIVIFVVTALGVFLHKRDVLRLSFLKPKGKKAYERASSTFTMIAGAFLLIAGTHEYLFSPNLTMESGIPMLLIVLQIAIGLAFLVGMGTRLAAILLGVLWILAIPYASLLSMVENIWILSTAFFILIMGNDYFSLVSYSLLRKATKSLRKYAHAILRLGTGATLFVLGLSEKILAPEYGVNFLEQHDWNFMQNLGFNYSDYLFTISAGSVELLFGLIFMLGVVTRLNALVVAVVFSAPLFILGPIELAGHLPHFAAVVLLLLFGNGGRLLLFRTKKDKEECPV